MVEREPMWDGNMVWSVYGQMVYVVEREPMWDGNASVFSSLVMVSVEREPMWDGNVLSPLRPHKSLHQLSENQCLNLCTLT